MLDTQPLCVYTNAIKRDDKSFRLLKVYIGRVVPTCVKIKEKTAEKKETYTKERERRKTKGEYERKKKKKEFHSNFQSS